MKTMNKGILQTREEVLDVLRGGKMFTVTFVKGDGTIRVMNGQFGNKSLLDPWAGRRSPNNRDEDHNTVTMAEFGAFSGGGNFKRFRVDRLISVKAHGRVYYGPKGWSDVERLI